jgi:hypothetical protein
MRIRKTLERVAQGFFIYYNNDDDYDENGVTVNTDRGHHTTAIFYIKPQFLYKTTIPYIKPQLSIKNITTYKNINLHKIYKIIIIYNLFTCLQNVSFIYINILY